MQQTNLPIRGIEALVDQRIRRWSRTPPHVKEALRAPVVAVAREAGTLGDPAAARLAREFGMDFYDDQVIRTIAGQAHVTESVVRTLDEKGSTFVDDLFRQAVGRRGFTSDLYFSALARVIGTIDWHGNSVIVGHGAAFLLHSPRDLRVRFTAPLEWRVVHLMDAGGFTEEEARRAIHALDSDRRRFAHDYFRVHSEDAQHYDLVINNEFVGLDESVELMRRALELRSHAAAARSAIA